jgi:hypothetical protein
MNFKCVKNLLEFLVQFVLLISHHNTITYTWISDRSPMLLTLWDTTLVVHVSNNLYSGYYSLHFGFKGTMIFNGLGICNIRAQ